MYPYSGPSAHGKGAAQLHMTRSTNARTFSRETRPSAPAARFLRFATTHLAVSQPQQRFFLSSYPHALPSAVGSARRSPRGPGLLRPSFLSDKYPRPNGPAFSLASLSLHALREERRPGSARGRGTAERFSTPDVHHSPPHRRSLSRWFR